MLKFDRVVDVLKNAIVQIEALQEEEISEVDASRSHGARLNLARTIYGIRQLRNRQIDAKLFRDPAWDILLDLYIGRAEGKKISVSSACLATNVPPTTALRWLKLLEDSGLLSRSRKDGDARVILVDLTPRAIQALDRLLGP